MELEMKTKLAEVMPKQIEFNYAPLKAELAEQLAYYKALVVTEESAKVAKSDLAKLRKLKESLNAKKISIKKEFMAPYTAFENEVLFRIDWRTCSPTSPGKDF
jgi:argininosuccinate lyase